MFRRHPATQTFCDLLIWKRAHQFVLGVYQLTAGFPRQETFGLSLQMRRAAMSIAVNIVEGFAKRSKADKTRFLNISEASLEETRYYLIPAKTWVWQDPGALCAGIVGYLIRKTLSLPSQKSLLSCSCNRFVRVRHPRGPARQHRAGD
jgi:four helix bundle protein